MSVSPCPRFTGAPFPRCQGIQCLQRSVISVSPCPRFTQSPFHIFPAEGVQLQPYEYISTSADQNDTIAGVKNFHAMSVLKYKTR